MLVRLVLLSTRDERGGPRRSRRSSTNVDGIYGAQVGIQIELADAITVFQDPADPFTSSDASALLEELGDHRRSQSSLSATGVTHLVTGRDLTGSTVGIAYIAALCLSSYGASLSQGTASLVALIAAHEIGHNFGAPHDGEAAESGQPANPCEATPRTFLMAPQLNGSDQFSQCSLTQMQPEIDAAGSRSRCARARAIPKKRAQWRMKRCAAVGRRWCIQMLPVVKNVGTCKPPKKATQNQCVAQPSQNRDEL